MSLHFNRNWLIQKYIVEGFSAYDIANIVKRDPTVIYAQLKKFQIPTRPRGYNLKGEDNHWNQPGAMPTFLGKKHTEETKKILSEKASRPKPYLRGPHNGMSGRTGISNPNYQGGTSPERQRMYASGLWKEIARNVF